MSFFTLKLLCASLAGNIFVFAHFLHAFGWGKWCILGLPWFLAMGLYQLIYRWMGYAGPYFEAFAWVANIWLVVGGAMLLLFLAADILRLLAWLFKRLFGPRRASSMLYTRRLNREKSLLPPRLTALAVLMLALLFSGYAWREAHSIRPVFYTLPAAELPEERPRLRLAFVADMHINALIGPEEVRRVTECIAAQSPDIILLGGDIIDAAAESKAEEQALLAALYAPHGKFAVLGNHEITYGIDKAVAFLEGAGFWVLRNELVKTAGIAIVGVDDPRIATHQGTNNDNPMPLLQHMARQTGPRAFTLLLEHRPWLRLDSVGLMDLQLSGHTHGGQIWPANYLMDAIYGNSSGLSFHSSPRGESALFITVGTGYAKMPMRFRNPPEVVIIDLIRQ